MVRLLTAAAVAAVALLAAGCGSGGGTQAATTTVRRSTASPAAVLRRFIAAAGRGDARTEWRLLSPASRRRLGPFSAFASGVAAELSEGAGSYARSSDLSTALSRALGGGWAVAAVAGTRIVEGTREHSAYAVPLRRVGGAWRIELGGTVELRPEKPAEQPTSTPVEVSFTAVAKEKLRQIALWVDGRERALRHTAGHYTSTYAPSGGGHVAVAFAATSSEAGATAWTFHVRTG